MSIQWQKEKTTYKWAVSWKLSSWLGEMTWEGKESKPMKERGNNISDYWVNMPNSTKTQAVLLTCMSAAEAQPDWWSRETELLSGLFPLAPDPAPSTPPENRLYCLRDTSTHTEIIRIISNYTRHSGKALMCVRVEWAYIPTFTTKEHTEYCICCSPVTTEGWG